MSTEKKDKEINGKNKSNVENSDIENLESINVGIVGHIDHGKTTLLKQLTGKWADRHSEELKRGITIKLGYADCIIKEDNGKYNLEKGKPIKYVSFVDAPGHEMLMATMLSGAAMIDAAILVVAANEGVRPQTIEHLMSLQVKGVKNIVVVQNKIDLVSKEEAKENYGKIKDFLKGTIAEKSPIIPCSVLQGVNTDKVLEALANVESRDFDEDKSPVFDIARSFDINKPSSKISDLNGGVLGGALKQGRLKEGDEIEIKPGLTIEEENKINYKTLKTKVLSLYKGYNKISEARPGGSVAIETDLDPITTKADKLSGCVAGLKEELPEIKHRIWIEFDLFEKISGTEKHQEINGIKTAENLLLSVGTATTVGTVTRVKDNKAEINLRIPIVPFEDHSIGIARNIDSHWRLIGLGYIVDEEK